ncbi:unnamed protein product [Lathyrus oleraceus]
MSSTKASLLPLIPTTIFPIFHSKSIFFNCSSVSSVLPPSFMTPFEKISDINDLKELRKVAVCIRHKWSVITNNKEYFKMNVVDKYHP